MPRLPFSLLATIALSGLLVLAACVPYHPQRGQESYIYNPVPGGNH